MFADSVSILEWSLLIFRKICLQKLKIISWHHHCYCFEVKVTDMETCLGYALKLYVKVRCTVQEYIYSPAQWWYLQIILKYLKKASQIRLIVNSVEWKDNSFAVHFSLKLCKNVSLLQFESLNSNISNCLLVDFKISYFILTPVSMHQSKLFYWFYIHNLTLTLVNVKK